MNILVTGGAGFIGSLLCKKLLERDHNVICVDNLILGNKNNIESFKSNERFYFYQQDITDKNALFSVFKEHKFDIVYHLAANSDIQKSALNPEIDFKDTFLTTYTVLLAMREFGVKKLFFSSTSAVYGEKLGVKLTETTGDLRPISNYGGSKLASESFIHSFTYMNDFSTLIFRFPNVIGPNLTHGVLFDFKKKLQKNHKELEIFGDGTQQKPYIHVDDLIEAILLLSKNIKKGVDIYNVGVEDSTTVTEIAEILCQELRLNDVKFKYTGGDRGWKGDVPKFEYDLTKIHSQGWKPKYTSNEAVRETAKYLSKI